MIRLPPYTQNADGRGSFLGLTRDAWAEVNFIETAAGQVRGNHYHKETRELFFIIDGEIEIEVADVRNGAKQAFVARKGDLFVIEPYELHTFRTRCASQWINMLSRTLDPQKPDFHRPSANGDGAGDGHRDGGSR